MTSQWCISRFEKAAQCWIIVEPTLTDSVYSGVEVGPRSRADWRDSAKLFSGCDDSDRTVTYCMVLIQRFTFCTPALHDICHRGGGGGSSRPDDLILRALLPAFLLDGVAIQLVVSHQRATLTYNPVICRLDAWHSTDNQVFRGIELSNILTISVLNVMSLCFSFNSSWNYWHNLPFKLKHYNIHCTYTLCQIWSEKK